MPPRRGSVDLRTVDFKELFKTLKRAMSIVFRRYKIHCIVVVFCILGQAACTLAGTLFLQSLIDDYILPLTKMADPDFTPLLMALLRMAAIYALGIVFSFSFNIIMAFVTQGSMRDIRDEIFEHMETLPIRYFDTHAHGDIMSVYTNDVDTLRQLISQSIPQLISSSVTIIFTLTSMIILDLPLTILTLAMVGVMIFVSSKIMTRSAIYFGKQQAMLGKVNGYIEEMMEGQKVVKVFCHEDKNLEGFRSLNEDLREAMEKAHTYSNITMPVNANIGNISYVLCAIVGAFLVLSGFSSLTLGTLVSFMNLNRRSVCRSTLLSWPWLERTVSLN